jgi:hypothetical protein
MCYGCYEEAGKPVPTEQARAVGIRLREVDPYGGCHIVREDWNVEDGNIDFCLADPATTEPERDVMRALRELPEDQRYAALATADGYTDEVT